MESIGRTEIWTKTNILRVKFKFCGIVRKVVTYCHLIPSGSIFNKTFCFVVARWSGYRWIASSKRARFVWIKVNHTFIIFFERRPETLYNVFFSQFQLNRRRIIARSDTGIFEAHSTFVVFIRLSNGHVARTWNITTISIIMFWSNGKMNKKFIKNIYRQRSSFVNKWKRNVTRQ